MDNKFFTPEELAVMDRLNATTDALLMRSRSADPEPEPEPAPASRRLTDAEIAALVDRRVRELADQLTDEVGEVLGELFKEVDQQVKNLVSRIVDLEVANKNLTEAKADRISAELASMRETLQEVVDGVGAVRSGNIAPFRKVN